MLVLIGGRVFEVWKAPAVFVRRPDGICAIVDVTAAVVVILLTATLWVVEIVVAVVDSALVVVELVSTSVTAEVKSLIMLQYPDCRLQ